MTPKEKAEDLWFKFFESQSTEENSNLDGEIAYQSALIAIEEIIEATKSPYQIKYDNGEWSRDIGYRYDEYWLKVKQEIEKL